MKSFLFLFFLYICISAQTETTIQLKDGKIFDKGFELTKPSENAPEELNKLHPEFSAHSKYFDNYDGPLFKSPELGNYELLKAFAGSSVGGPLPAEIRKLLDRTNQENHFPGAYPPLP